MKKTLVLDTNVILHDSSCIHHFQENDVVIPIFVLEELGFAWYEEPMREFDLGSYAKLCHDLDIPILAAECSDGAHWNAAEFIRRGACDIMRTSTHYKGGFTGGLKVAHLAESFGMNAEVHGGGLPSLQRGPDRRQVAVQRQVLVVRPRALIGIQVRDFPCGTAAPTRLCFNSGHRTTLDF